MRPFFERIMNIRIAVLAILFFCLCVPSFAQEGDDGKFFGVGFGFSENVPGKVIGAGFFGVELPGISGAYAITGMQISGADDGGVANFTLGGKQMQYDMKEYFAYRFLKLGDRVSIISLVGGGFTAVDENVLGSFGGGGLVDIKVNDKFGVYFGPVLEYNSAKERTFNPWVGIRF